MTRGAGQQPDITAGPEGDGGLGPLLYLGGAGPEGLALSVIVVRPESAPAPRIAGPDGACTVTCIRHLAGRRIWRAAFTLGPGQAGYRVDGTFYPVAADMTGDLRIAFVSCNGQETADLHRSPADRNRLWARMARQHAAAPFNLLLQGGDQIYADEVLDADPVLRRWREGRADAQAPLSCAARADLAAKLERAFLERYLHTLGQPETAWLMARVPSLAIWDDHDICDGWGSLAPGQLRADVGRLLFATARAGYLMFQAGTAPDAVPRLALDRTGESLGWHLALPDLDVIAPDLRSERRPDRVMGANGWQGLEAALAGARAPRTLLLSSVPALGPRLSLIEAVLHLVPGAQKYEDDLRDQWQSRAHRREWRRFLRLLADHHAAGHATTVISGEIHLATRGTLDVPPAPLHQLVASGITHPAPPRAWARALGALARIGESPLPGHGIRLRPLPGRRGIYRAERNYLVLARRSGSWQAWWELEESGATPALTI